MTPIGFVKTGEVYRFEAPRQGVFARNRGVIELAAGKNFEAAVADLAGVERIWVIFLFDRNGGHWTPLTAPPVAPDRKISLFATRSPYRPNPVGLSCVELERVEGRKLFIRNFDLLDGTPVLDIKPYIPEADAFPDSRVPWLEEARREEYTLTFSEDFRRQAALIKDLSGLDLERFCRVQLGLRPFDRRRKRLSALPGGDWTIGCRTWRIRFAADREKRRIEVLSITGSYTEEELVAGAPDRYSDKEFHRQFRQSFPKNSE